MSRFNTCGQCYFARITKETSHDLTQRVCRGAPPSAIAIPHPQGVQIRAFYPPVTVSDEACGAFRSNLQGNDRLKGLINDDFTMGKPLNG